MIKFENHDNYNCQITLSDGQQFLVYANWMHNNGMDTWQGWHCQAGHTRFYIDNNFDVWSGQCKNDHLGNVLDQWSVKQDSICQMPNCTGCTDDLLTTKYKHA